MSESPRGAESAENVGTSGRDHPDLETGHGGSPRLEFQQEKVLEALANYMRESGHPASVLHVGDNDVTAEQLWLPVMHGGGFEAVTDQKGWAAIGRLFNPPKGMTDLSHKVKRAFEVHLLAFEQAIRNGQVDGVTMPNPNASMPKGHRAQKRQTSAEPGKKLSTKRSKGSAGKRNEEQTHVGKRILIKMSSQDGSGDAFYIGTVKSFKKDQHHIDFDDGDSDEVNLAEEVWRFATDQDEKEAAEHDGRVAIREEGAQPNEVSPSSTPDAGGQHNLPPNLAPQSHPIPTSEAGGSPAQLGKQDPQSHANAGPSAVVVGADTKQGAGEAPGSAPQPQTKMVSSGEGFKVHRSEDDGTPGYEIYVMATGMTKDDVKVKCWPEGRVRVKARPQKDIANWTEEPIERTINLPTPIDPYSAKALITLHGLLFIKVAAKQDST